MGKRKISILEPAATAVAEIAMFIEGEGLSQTAKKFVDEAFEFFLKLSDERIEDKPSTYKQWKNLKLLTIVTLIIIMMMLCSIVQCGNVF